jgi:hypothetical protein
MRIKLINATFKTSQAVAGFKELSLTETCAPLLASTVESQIMDIRSNVTRRDDLIPIAILNQEMSIRIGNLTYERLDRVLMKTEWEYKYPLVTTVRTLGGSVSDHTPLLLDTGTPAPSREWVDSSRWNGSLLKISMIG